MRRLWGNSAYDTAIDVASSGNSLFDFDKSAAFLARGDYFTDGLVAGALASMMGPAPVVLASTESIPESTYLWLAANRDRVRTLFVFGGQGALSEDVEWRVRWINGPDPVGVDSATYAAAGETSRVQLIDDVNSDGIMEVIVLFGKPWDVSVQDPLLMRMLILGWDGRGYSSFWEHRFEGEVSVDFWVEDINRDGVREIISYQNIGNGYFYM